MKSQRLIQIKYLNPTYTLIMYSMKLNQVRNLRLALEITSKKMTKRSIERSKVIKRLTARVRQTRCRILIW